MAAVGSSRGTALVRRAAIVLVTGLALWIAIGVTLNFTIAGQAPDLVRSWWPSGVTPKVAIGRRLLTEEQAPATTIDAARAMLRDAVLREPVNTYALGTLAALADYRNAKAEARALFRLSETVSRRNVVTQLWLIEDAVGRENVAEAIAHYDRAMRVSIESRTTLLPVLLTAASDRAVLTALSPVLAQRPLWWKDYVQRLATSGEDTAVMASSLRSVRPNLRDPDERALAENVLTRMLTLKDQRGAIRTANDLEGLRAPDRSLRDGSFDGADGVLPFAWWLRDEGNLRTYRDAVPDGTQGLRIVTGDDAGGGAAQQLVGLSTGSYMLTGVAGDVPADPKARPAIEVTCGNGVSLTRFALPPAGEQGRRFGFRFAVDAVACPTQWIVIVAPAAADTSVWIDNLAIAR